MFRRFRAIVVSLLLIAAVVYLASQPTEPPRRYRLPNEVGFLEHRGKRYYLNELFDPAFRAASEDPFVKRFGQTEEVAGYISHHDKPGVQFRPRTHHRQAAPFLDARIAP